MRFSGKNAVSRTETVRGTAITILALLMALLGIANLLPLRGGLRGALNGGFLSPHLMALHHTLSVVIGCALLFVSYRLHKRMRTAFYIAVCLLPLSALLHLYSSRPHGFSLVVAVELAMELALLLLRRNFTRSADPITLRRGFLFALFSLALVLLNTAMGLFAMRRHFDGVETIYDALYQSLRLFVFADVSGASPNGLPGLVFIRSAIGLYWISLIAALIFILKPLVYQPIASSLDRARVRRLLRLYGFNSVSYVDMEHDKKYYFGETAEGFIAYVLEADTAVCVGDPVCKTEDCPLLLSDFIRFCRQNGLGICFCQAAEEHKAVYKSLGFGLVKAGEEALFELGTYRPDGPKASKIRRDVHSAERKGVTVEEYKPLLARDAVLEQEIKEVSQDWLSRKKSGELSFLLGSVGLDDPLDRRYFVARGRTGQVCAFIVFLPFVDGYYADVTRRRQDAPAGAMESIMLKAFQTFRDEGVRWGSMGVAPLANMKTDTRSTRVAALLSSVFEHANGFYAFKSLYQYKKKYNPTRWVPCYFAYYPAMFTPRLAYALINALNRGGVKDFLLNRVRHLASRTLRFYKRFR